MACDRDQSLSEKLIAVGKPRFNVFEERRLGGVPPPEIESASDALAIPADIKGLWSLDLIPEDGASAAWLAAHVRHGRDIFAARIPACAGDNATSCIFPRQVGQHSWPTTEYKPIDRSEASCLRVTDVRGKGKGCVVARTIPRGELVARERALILLPRTFVSPQQVASVLVKSLSPNQRASFSALYNCTSAKPDDAVGIILTNGLPVPGMPGHSVLYTAVFETFARINHSCCPNAMFRWDKDTFSGEIRALRPISEGEEITIAYILGMPERQRDLLGGYNFTCTCPICARSSTARARSDIDRPFIIKTVIDIGTYYREIVHDWITHGGNDHARLLNYLHTVEAALDREMIFHPIYWIYLARVIVMVRCALREGKAARKWAQRAAQHSRAFSGSDGGWDAIAREPEKCEWWGKWNKPRLRGIWA